MKLCEMDDDILSEFELLEYMIPIDSNSSGESSGESEPSNTPSERQPVSVNSETYKESTSVERKITNPPNTCLVCGDPTKCCHYDVPSCSGCKAFFRRTVINGKSYVCKTNGKCNMKVKDRCLQCRFDQCILVGMNPAAIKLPKTVDLTKVLERIEFRKRTLANRDMETITDATSLPPSSSTTPESPEVLSVIPAKMPSIRLPQPMEFRDVDILLFLELKVRKLRESNYHPSYGVSYTLQSIIDSRTALSNVDKYTAITEPQVTLQQFQQDAIAFHNGEKPRVQYKHRRRHWLAVDIFLSIELAKTLPVFELLTTADKEAFILNATLSTAILTKSYYSHEKKCDTIVYPDGFMPVWLFTYHTKKLSKLASEVFIRTLQPIQRIDLAKEEYVLLKAIIFCNPACNNISDEGLKLLERESVHYSKTLLRYMQSIHGEAKGASRYGQVISIMEAMTYFAERGKEFHMVKMISKPGTRHYHYHSVNRVLHNIMEA
uniref:NR LBD domain-containing protein n=2 Tax=Panagrellus redivivus TaxID=6233 RepID=A0A7E5A206_PANRE